MLLHGDPGKEDEYFCVVSRLKITPVIEAVQRFHGISIETGSFAPVKREHGTWITYLFVMCGLTWCFVVSEAGVPEIMRNTYIKENGHFFMLPLDGDSFLIEFAQKAVRAGNVTKADAEESTKAKISKA